MALINCPECGKEISDKATTCPNCGNPISPVIKKKPSILGFLGILGGILAFICCVNVLNGAAIFFGFLGVVLCVIDIYTHRDTHNVTPAIIGIIVCIIGTFDAFF